MTHNPLQGRLSFRREPRATGLRSIAQPYPDTQIKIGGRLAGYIRPPNRTDPEGWRVTFMVRDSRAHCGWRWVLLKKRCATEMEGRALWDRCDGELRAKYDIYTTEAT